MTEWVTLLVSIQVELVLALLFATSSCSVISADLSLVGLISGFGRDVATNSNYIGSEDR